MDDISFDSPPDALERPRRSWNGLWRAALAFLGVSFAGAAFAGLLALKQRAYSDWSGALSDFKWVVLVSGEPLQIDEVGRSLKELDAVAGVVYKTPQDMMTRLSSEPLLAKQLDAIDPAQLPGSWLVEWTPEFDASKMGDTLDEIRRMPGVVDVAFDTRQLDKVRVFRLMWLDLRLVLSILAAIGTLIAVLLFGRFLFFRPGPLPEAARVWALLIFSTVAWAAGAGVVAALVGPFSWHVLWGGPIVGLTRLAWAGTRRPA
ncbi:MAG: hypothetical protein JO102_01980 [Elusimicrobia bacterium]|nr:hypothetical protein [Elusimicrobiota bacterium]